jgi:hypothetical protein
MVTERSVCALRKELYDRVRVGIDYQLVQLAEIEFRYPRVYWELRKTLDVSKDAGNGISGSSA